MPAAISTGFEQYQDKFTEWGRNDPAVRAIVIVGSQARLSSSSAPLADAWSDLDLIVFYTPPLNFNPVDVGEVLISAFDPAYPAGSNWACWQILFVDWLKIDVTLSAIHPPYQSNSTIGELFQSTPYPYIFDQGIKILYDRYPTKDVMAIPEGSPRQINQPSEIEFTEQVGAFWLQAVHAAQLDQRGETWYSGQVLYHEIRQSLLRLVEWHSRCVFKTGHPIYWRGRQLETWADPRAVRALADCSGKGDGPGVQDALIASCRVAEWLTREISESLEYTCPTAVTAADIVMFHVKHSDQT